MLCRPVSVSLSSFFRVAPHLADGPKWVRRQPLGRVIIAALSPALFILATLAPWGPAQAKSLHPDYRLLRGQVQQYGEWLAACDNRGDCTLLGIPRPIEISDCDCTVIDMAIRISLTGPAGSELVVELQPLGRGRSQPSAVGASQPFVLNVAGAEQSHGFSRHALSSLEAAGVIELLTQGKPLLGLAKPGGSARARFPGEGFVRAFRAVQERRAVLLALPVMRSEPLRRIPAKPQIISGYSPILSTNRCGKVPTRNMERFTFESGAELWIYECADRSTTRSAHLAMSGKTGMPVMPLRLPDLRDGPVDATGKGLFVGDFVFDFDFGILRLYQLDQARSDCGTFRAWGYTRQGWFLLERREMPLCKGLEPDEWIRTHHTLTEGTGPDA
jgi:hypothetical protein